MKTRVVLVAVTLFAVATVFALRSGAQPTTSPSPARWEYASFLRSNEAAVWQAPDQSAVAPDVFGVYERLGGKLPRGKAANTEVLNLVGQKGWERARGRDAPARPGDDVLVQAAGAVTLRLSGGHTVSGVTLLVRHGPWDDSAVQPCAGLNQSAGGLLERAGRPLLRVTGELAFVITPPDGSSCSKEEPEQPRRHTDRLGDRRA